MDDLTIVLAVVSYGRMNTYTTVYLQVDPQYGQELISLSIKNFGCAGVEEYSLAQDWINKFLGQRVLVEWEIPPETYEQIDAAVAANAQGYKFYFTGEQHATKAQDFIAAAKKLAPLTAVSEELPDQDWNQEWKKGYQKIEVSKKMAVLPVWEAAQKTSYELPIIINPGMGFGTGTHETTFLCLQELEELLPSLGNNPAIRPGRPHVLDFGCGSGILGIAALKMGAALVDFCDIDPLALANCADNIKLNFEKSSLPINLYLREKFTPPSQSYDVVVANILLSALESENELLRNVVKVGGYLIISGVFTDQLEALAKIYREDASPAFKQLFHRTKGEWAMSVWQRIR